MEEDWQPRDTAPYGKLLMVWWLPIDDNPYAETWTIGSRVYRDDGLEPLQTDKGEAKTDNWWIDGRYYEPRHVSNWRLLPRPPKDRPSEAVRISCLRAKLPAQEIASCFQERN